MKKFRYMLAALAAAAIVAAVLVGCKKEKVANDDTPKERQPIAVFDKHTGVMTTLVDVDKLNDLFNESNQLKGESDRFVIENVILTDEQPCDYNSYAELELTVLDVENECTYTIWLMKEYTQKEIKSQVVEYRLSDDIVNNEYSFGYTCENHYYMGIIQDDTFVSQEVDSLFYGTMPKYLLACRSSDCEDKCEKAGNFWHAYCKRCPLPDGDCNEDISIYGLIGVAVVGGVIGGILVMLI